MQETDQPLWNLSTVMDNTTESFILLDKDLKVIGFNRMAVQRAGQIGVSLIEGDSILKQAPLERHDFLKQIYSEVLSGTQKEYYHELLTHSGVQVIYHLQYIPFRKDGEIAGIMINARDVTLEQQAVKQGSLAENKLRALIQEGDDLISIFDHQKEISFVSPNLKKVLGYETTDLMGLNLNEFLNRFIHPEDHAKLLTEFNRVEKLRKLHVLPFRFKNVSGNWEWLESILTNLYKEESVNGLVINSRIITERVEAEETLKQTYQQLSKILHSSLDIICTIDQEGKFVLVSDATESILGYSASDLSGKYMIDFVLPEDRKATLDIFTKIDGWKSVKNLENRFIHADKSIVYMMWSVSINEGDQLIYCVGRDMSEKKLIERKTVESAELTKSIVDSMDESILVINTQAELIFANNSFLRTAGEISSNDYESWSQRYSLYDKTTRKEIAKEERPIIRALRGEHVVAKEYLLIDPVYGDLTVMASATAIRDTSGKIIAAMAVKRNVTAQRKAESELKKSQQQISKIFNTVSDVLFMLKVEGPDKYRFVMVNQPFYDTTGLTADQVINKYVHEVIPEPSLSLVLQKYAEAIQLRKTATWEEETPYPTGKKTGIVTITPILDDKGMCIELIGSVNDITMIKEAATAVYKSNERFEYVTKATSEAIWDWDLITHEYYRSEGFSTLFGLNSETTKADIKFWQAYIHPEDKFRIVNSIQEALAGKVQDWSGQYRYLKADGEFAIVADRSVIIRSDNGQATRMIGAMQDITERKRAEELLQQQNEELQKINHELDSFVYSASHELRSPLTAIMGLILLARNKTNPADLEDLLNLMEKSVHNLDQVIKDIINYSRNARLDVANELIGFEEMIKDSINLFSYLEGGDKVTFNIEMNEFQPFFSDRNRIAIILNNIISNAIKYRNPQVESKVDIQVTQKAHAAEISIADNGLGIPEEKLSLVFKMFFRLSSKMPGSGLGLFIVKEIVNKLGGSIQVTSVLGQGTTFIVSIPNAMGQAIRPGQTAASL